MTARSWAGQSWHDIGQELKAVHSSSPQTAHHAAGAGLAPEDVTEIVLRGPADHLPIFVFSDGAKVSAVGLEVSHRGA